MKKSFTKLPESINGIHTIGYVVGKGEKRRKFIILNEDFRKELQ